MLDVEKTLVGVTGGKKEAFTVEVKKGDSEQRGSRRGDKWLNLGYIKVEPKYGDQVDRYIV